MPNRQVGLLPGELAAQLFIYHIEVFSSRSFSGIRGVT
jgi:hypothetical protein